MKIAIANDHAGVEYKNLVVNHLLSQGYQVENLGTDQTTSCDYPDYAKLVANKVSSKQVDFGILICGTGVGMSICANKFKGIRASLCSDEFTAEMTRKHNNSNILCLGARTLGIENVYRIVDIYLKTNFDGGRHQNRIDKIADIEQNR